MTLARPVDVGEGGRQKMISVHFGVFAVHRSGSLGAEPEVGILVQGPH